jgi:alkanesulfonate monooxygenase SsuD/methylene tetrahydromethanopterin reductase-like flavin-dependent oxidoreductase (luciferase family)
MRFIAFHLMPYRNLPGDFEERYPSVWVNVPKQLYDPVEGHRLYHQYLDELEFAVDLGYDGVGVNEHHSNAYGLMPSPNLMGSILARKIRHARATALLVLGNSIALYNPPIRVAEEMAMLDVLSGGKFIGGFPVGTSMDTNYCYGVNPAEMRDRYYEAHDLIVKSWKSETPFAFNGKYTQLRYVNPWPRPMQTPHPRIWIPGGGSVETYDFAIKNDYSFSYLSFFGYRYAKKVMGPFWERAQALGADMNPYRAGYAQLLCVSETDARAQSDYEQHVRYFFAKCLHIDPRHFEAPGYRTAATLRAGLRSQFEAAESATQLLREGKLDWGGLVDKGFVIAGSPATVRDRLMEAAQELNTGNVLLLNHIGSMPHHLTMKNFQIFAEEVMPQIRRASPFAKWDPSAYWPEKVLSPQV